MKVTFELKEDDLHLLGVFTNAMSIHGFLFELQYNFHRKIESLQDSLYEKYTKDEEREIMFDSIDKAHELLRDLINESDLPRVH